MRRLAFKLCNLLDQARRSRNAIRRPLGLFFERLEPRMMLAASAIDDRPYIELGTSDNVALDQPRVTVQLIQGSQIVGPEVFSNWLLDTGANTTLTFQSAINEMNGSPPYYQTQGQFAEIGVGGFHFFDVSIPYRFDFAGFDGVRQTLSDARILSDPTHDLSIFGPWGIHGMPGMTERYTTFDFTGWMNPGLEDLYMKTTFPTSLPSSSNRYSISVNNNVHFAAEDGVITGAPPVWADVPFFDAQVKNGDLVSTGNFLFDTGAQVSIISTRMALELGLDTNGDNILDHNDAQFARMESVGGVGGMITVPVFLIDEVHLPTNEGPDLVWTDLQWLILDIVDGIDGVFGFDNITSGWVEAFFNGTDPGYLMKVHLDFHGWNTTGDGTIYFDLNPASDAVVDPTGPGVIIHESGGSTLVSEMGHTDTYTVQLSEQPSANVTIHLNRSNNVTAWRQGFPSQQSLTFTPANWDVPQVVQVNAVNDTTQQSYHRGNVRHTATSSDPAFHGIGLPRVTVHIIDNDFPAVMVVRSEGETRVSEDGLTDTYQLVLSYPPTSNVQVVLEHIGNQLVVTNAANGSNSVTFTPSNWNVPQTVRVAALDDDLVEGLHRGWITHRVVTSDFLYQQAFAMWEIAFIEDNDQAAPPPTVLDVIVASSQWSASTIDLVDGGGIGNGNGLGYSLVGGHQLDNLPWHNLDRIYIVFSEDVGATFASNNVALVGTNLSDYSPSLNFGVAGQTVGTLILSQPIEADALILAISENLGGGAAAGLDGDWVDGSSSFSGDGIPGGQFNFRIDVLPGDFDNNGTVNFADMGIVRNVIGQQVTSAQLTKYDFDVSGLITFIDLGVARQRIGATLPAPPPAPSFGSGGELFDGMIGGGSKVGNGSHFVHSTERFDHALRSNGIVGEDARLLPALQWDSHRTTMLPIYENTLIGFAAVPSQLDSYHGADRKDKVAGEIIASLVQQDDWPNPVRTGVLSGAARTDERQSSILQSIAMDRSAATTLKQDTELGAALDSAAELLTRDQLSRPPKLP